MTEHHVDAARDEAVEAMTGLVRYLAGELVDHPERTAVTAERRGHHIAVRLEVPEDELGQAIGRGGRIARSMRTALMISGSRHDVRVSLDIEARPPAAGDEPPADDAGDPSAEPVDG